MSINSGYSGIPVRFPQGVGLSAMLDPIPLDERRSAERNITLTQWWSDRSTSDAVTATLPCTIIKRCAANWEKNSQWMRWTNSQGFKVSLVGRTVESPPFFILIDTYRLKQVPKCIREALSAPAMQAQVDNLKKDQPVDDNAWNPQIAPISSVNAREAAHEQTQQDGGQLDVPLLDVNKDPWKEPLEVEGDVGSRRETHWLLGSRRRSYNAVSNQL